MDARHRREIEVAMRRLGHMAVWAGQRASCEWCGLSLTKAIRVVCRGSAEKATKR